MPGSDTVLATDLGVRQREGPSFHGGRRLENQVSYYGTELHFLLAIFSFKQAYNGNHYGNSIHALGIYFSPKVLFECVFESFVLNEVRHIWF